MVNPPNCTKTRFTRYFSISHCNNVRPTPCTDSKLFTALSSYNRCQIFSFISFRLKFFILRISTPLVNPFWRFATLTRTLRIRTLPFNKGSTGLLESYCFLKPWSHLHPFWPFLPSVFWTFFLLWFRCVPLAFDGGRSVRSRHTWCPVGGISILAVATIS